MLTEQKKKKNNINKLGHCGLNSDGLLKVYARKLYDVV